MNNIDSTTSKKSHKITLLIPYFGEWPSYFNVYLEGCNHNKWLNIIFFTNCKTPENHPNNITFIPHSLETLSVLINKKLNLSINLTYPYKLCDFKPCYGKIFEEYIKDSDYWGYGDIDLIYGDLKSNVLNRIQIGYDVLSHRMEILSGSLCIIKNTDFLVNLYAQSPVFVEQLSHTDYRGLDETAHSLITWKGGNKLELPTHCFTYLVASEDKKGSLKASFISLAKEYISNEQVIKYDNGILWFENTSIAYYHYVNNKNVGGYKLPNWQLVPKRFFITSTGFYKNNRLYTLIHYYRKMIGFTNNLFNKIKNRLK